MKLVVNDAPALKSIIDCIGSLVEEGQFEVKSDGIYLKAMDPSQISMISFSMPKTSFVEYNVPEETRMGLDIVRLSELLSRGKKGEKAEIYLEENRLAMTFSGAKHKRTFKIPLIETANRVNREPRVGTNIAVVRSDAIKDALKDAKLMSTYVKLQVTAEKFMVDVLSDNGELKAEFEKGSPEVPEITASESVTATYPIQYLEDMVRSASSSAMMKISLGTDMPLKLEYEMDGAKFTYYLAPRTEREG
ncbi:DNA polymerase sliding clamp [Candidatus Micrarchaeota archaeon]|nr:DNA polymerase sliding clamp [Candidatus Micrarchaeota archaeon]